MWRARQALGTPEESTRGSMLQLSGVCNPQLLGVFSGLERWLSTPTLWMVNWFLGLAKSSPRGPDTDILLFLYLLKEGF